MTIAEGAGARVTYKAYATGAISSTTQPTSSTDPAATGGQILNRVAVNAMLTKDAFADPVIRADRQAAPGRHGTKRAPGGITGTLRPGEWWAFLEAACRGTGAAALSFGASTFTSVVSDNGASTFTLGGGDPVSSGFRVGEVIRFASLSETDNNDKNFLITGFSGGSNRTIAVYPAPETQSSADTSFTISRPGESVIIPASSHVSRKFAIEKYWADIDIAHLVTEWRCGGFRLGLGPNNVAGIEVLGLARDVETYSAGSAPFFTSPTAASTAEACATANGIIRVNGTVLGVVTGLEMSLELPISADPTINSLNVVPDIFLGQAQVTGRLSAYIEDLSLFNLFKNETVFDVAGMFTNGTDNDAELVALYMPAVKLFGADMPLTGEGGQVGTYEFRAQPYAGSAAGVPVTTLLIHDTLAA